MSTKQRTAEQARSHLRVGSRATHLDITQQERAVIDELATVYLGGVGYDQWVADGQPTYAGEALGAWHVMNLVGPALDGLPPLQIPVDDRARRGLHVLRDYEAGGIPDEQRRIAEYEAEGLPTEDAVALLTQIRARVTVIDRIVARYPPTSPLQQMMTSRDVALRVLLAASNAVTRECRRADDRDLLDRAASAEGTAEHDRIANTIGALGQVIQQIRGALTQQAAGSPVGLHLTGDVALLLAQACQDEADSYARCAPDMVDPEPDLALARRHRTDAVSFTMTAAAGALA